MITDESTNGVFVNGARIEGATLLRQGTACASQDRVSVRGG